MDQETELHVVQGDSPACVHHWVLSDPMLGAVTGRCKRCGGERVFSARLEANERPDDERDTQSAEDSAAQQAG